MAHNKSEKFLFRFYAICMFADKQGNIKPSDFFKKGNFYRLDEKLLKVKFPSTTSETQGLIPSRVSSGLFVYTSKHNLLCFVVVCFFVEKSEM